MKFLIALCLIVVYLFAEASAKPTSQLMDQAREILKEAQEKAQDLIKQAQETADRVRQTVQNAMQNGINSAQKTAQNAFSRSGFSGLSEAVKTDQSTVAA